MRYIGIEAVVRTLRLEPELSFGWRLTAGSRPGARRLPPRRRPICRPTTELIHSQHTNTQTVTPSTRHSHLAHITPASFKCSQTCDAYRAHRHGSELPYPGSTPGLNPCNHLARQACGPWRTHKHNTYIQARRQRRHEELKIHRRVTRR